MDKELEQENIEPTVSMDSYQKVQDELQKIKQIADEDSKHHIIRIK